MSFKSLTHRTGYKFDKLLNCDFASFTNEILVTILVFVLDYKKLAYI